jgi:hypothetical protein
MKKIVSLILLVAMFTACNTDLDINRDPDSPITIPLSSELPAGIAGLIGAEGSSYALIGGFWSQYWTQSTSANQYKDIDGYIIGTGDYFGAWRDMYDALGDIRTVKRKALEEQNWNYYLIACVLDAQGSQVLTDFYGDIPYKEANNQNILQPKFNTGIEVYDSIITELNDALSKDLSKSKGELPSKGDLIFGGGMEKWTAFANTLKLKIYTRQLNSSRATIATTGINQLLSSGVSFLAVDAGMNQFTDARDLSNPLYESDRRRLNVATNLRMSFTMSSFLTSNSDDRKSKYYGSGNALFQGEFDNGNINANTISIVNLSATTPAYLMSLEESLFLQAEAQARFGSSATAKTLYDQAVSENFNKYGLSSAAYTGAGGKYEFPSSGNLDAKIKSIITQKWVANFPGNGFESFFEANRTGYPRKSTVSQKDPLYVPGELAYSIGGATGGVFPARIVYPQEETNTNPNTPLTTVNKITTPVWWVKP